MKMRKGQSTLEYVLLVTAVIVVMIGLLMSNSSPFRTTLSNSLNLGITRMGNMANTLFPPPHRCVSVPGGPQCPEYD